MDQTRNDKTGASRRLFRAVAGDGGVRKRQSLCCCLIAGLLLALVPVGALLHHPVSLRYPVLLVGLEALALATILGELWLKRPVWYSGLGAISLLALLVGGPLAAVLVLLAPEVLRQWRRRRERPVTRAIALGVAANVASYGWGVLAAAGVLVLAHGHSLSPRAGLVILAAGVALEVVNYGIARGVYGTLYQGNRLPTMIRDEFMSVLGGEVALLTMATLCALLIVPLGWGALAVAGGVLVVPQLLLPAVARSRDVTRLSQADATRLYVRALAAHLRVSHRRRRIAVHAGELFEADGGSVLPRSGVYLPAPPSTLRAHGHRTNEAWTVALHVTERWDGTGLPAKIGGKTIPLESRLIAVAVEWARLTAAGGPEMPQAEATLGLEAQSATRFDPRVVAAASEIVATESAFADLAAFQPKLHAIPLPLFLRERVIPRALAAAS
jgi:HD domain